MSTVSYETPTKLDPEAQQRRWAIILNKLGPLIGLAFVVLLFTVLRPRTFPTLGNLELILRLTAVVGTASLGMTLIIIAGGIDLSVGSAVALVTVVIGIVLFPHETINEETGKRIVGNDGSTIVAAVAGISVAVVCGAITGLLITRVKLLPFIVTLGMFGALRGFAERIAHNTMVRTGDTWLNDVLSPISRTHVWLLTPGVWTMLVLAVIVGAMLRYTRFGRHIFAIGSNEQTARLCGVRVDLTKVLIYMLASFFFGVAGVLQYGFLTMGDPTTANGLELDVIAAVVIGGASLSGGQGTVLGSLAGALIMSVVANGCNQLGVENSVQRIATGVIIIIAATLDRLRSGAIRDRVQADIQLKMWASQSHGRVSVCWALILMFART